MYDERIRLKDNTRLRIQEMKAPGETYTDVLLRILPDPEEEEVEILESTDKQVVSCNEEVLERVEALSESGVPAHRVVDYYLYRDEVQRLPEMLELVLEVRGGEAELESQ